MREIKFRCWIRQIGKMTDSFKLLEISEGIFNQTFINSEIMQFTGFKDINGKEIFEGDILRSRWTVDGSDEEGFDYYFCELNGQRWLHKKGYTDWSDILGHEEVIGNIYENKELLEVKKDGT